MVGTYDYIAETRYSWGGIVFPFSGGSRAVGVQVGTFGFKDQPVYTATQPEGTGSVYSVNETFVGLTLSQNFSDRFSAGLTAKGVFDQLGEASGQAFAVDFGTNFHSQLSGHPIQFSFVLANLGTNLDYSGTALDVSTPRDPLPNEDEVPENPQPSELRTTGFNLPTIFRVGLAYDVMTGENNRLTLLGDFNQPNNNRAGFSGGAEWNSQHLGGSAFGFAVRGSYSYPRVEQRRAHRSAQQHRAGRRGEPPGSGVRRRRELRLRELQPGPRLRLEVPRRAGRHELLQCFGRLVVQPAGCSGGRVLPWNRYAHVSIGGNIAGGHPWPLHAGAPGGAE